MISRISNKIPGRTVRKQISKKIIPPLWIWLRSGVFFAIAGVAMLFGVPSIAKMVITITVMQFIGITLATVMQEVAEGIKRLLGYNKKKGKK